MPYVRGDLTYDNDQFAAALLGGSGDNGLEGVESQWWDGATTFEEMFTADDSMTSAMDFQDSLDDMEQAPGTVDGAATAYDDDANGNNAPMFCPLPSVRIEEMRHPLSLA